MHLLLLFFFFQAEDGIRYLVRSRGLGDVYKRQAQGQPDQLGGCLVAGEMPPRLDDLAQPGIDALDGLSLIHI